MTTTPTILTSDKGVPFTVEYLVSAAPPVGDVPRIAFKVPLNNGASPPNTTPELLAKTGVWVPELEGVGKRGGWRFSVSAAECQSLPLGRLICDIRVWNGGNVVGQTPSAFVVITQPVSESAP
jgi:hypothetical protein